LDIQGIKHCRYLVETLALPVFSAEIGQLNGYSANELIFVSSQANAAAGSKGALAFQCVAEVNRRNH